ncbi:Fanconi anemia core complex-associated protein 24-like [Thrips palmi]|uniref:Fanconi anemia core complex-associated protein 24-like n=1 Tax=Thrips palmi TaxID=161013 RepID=A0A6P8ZXF4_THRPL|nr:Fanconi anemia core complex-associated protein 24-like [Thrips palmi]
MDITLSHPQKSALKVPVGQILVNKRWRGSSVSKELDLSECRTMFTDGLGFIDFFPADSFAVLYITEAELLTPKSFTERTKLLAKDYSNRGVILVDVCRSPGYQELQDLAAIEHNLSVFPISNQNEIPRILQALMHAEIRQSSNPFKTSAPELGDMGQVQMSLLKKIPGIGDKSAQKLLSSYGSIKSISEISQERLETKIGKADAAKVYNYFRKRISS